MSKPMTKILFLDFDGTVREPKSGAKFISVPQLPG
jgi:histidinol phosphatase-like enzyme